jgi:hypothetical protein
MSTNKYFSIMPHMADDDLDPYTYRLYGHYLRVCGQGNRPCEETTKQIAEKVKMSTGKVSSCRAKLAELGYINIEREIINKASNRITVTLCSVMENNIERYQSNELPGSPDELPGSPDELPGSPDERINKNINTKNYREESGNLDSSNVQARGNDVPQLPTSPPSFSKAKAGEYLPGLPNPKQRRAKVRVDGLMAQFAKLGIKPPEVTTLVNFVLEKQNKLQLANAGTPDGERALTKAQETVWSLAVLGPKFQTIEGIESIYQSWSKSWRGHTMPYLNQLVEHACEMTAKPDKVAPKKPLDPQKPEKKWLLGTYGIDSFEALANSRQYSREAILNEWQQHIRTAATG